jgi:hypothetical protein
MGYPGSAILTAATSKQGKMLECSVVLQRKFPLPVFFVVLLAVILLYG